MKTLLLVPVVALCACSSPKTPVSVWPLEPVSSSNASAARHPETVRAYHFGRYADPNNSLLLHGQHTVYRIDASARWNLRPSPDTEAASYAETANPSSLSVVPAVDDTIVAEVNRQKLVTAQMIARSAEISASLAGLHEALKGTVAGIQELTELRRLVGQLESRLRDIEATQGRQSTPVSGTHEGSERPSTDGNHLPPP